ncbi:EthD family reductase [Brevundimonas subvibrioides]|uniref:Ethyl tert-butyl ether degradation EthD n=1 Tax=Brevundimonas subvibrioides (strain ATCC 15264 / DSM 4735 / LMG 14903 / NBRC 16000 / CB 81) TaxID=633149 RepID=D9QHM3_BRESC|nr:EthD family reductase [Brevundimonas subvibrioides]ADL01189.1 Ethyl tert-butyl ether degradation EthD [Brevundimonas subvibrioides ATCC 15264]
MAQLVVTYRTPTDPAAFDAHYRDVHAPLARQIPGLRRFDLSDGPVMTPEGPSDIHSIAILTFDSLADLTAAMGSPEGQAAAADVGTFATGGASMQMFETREA